MVRRAMLDESTKKFIAWSGDRHLQLAELFLQEEERLQRIATDVPQQFGKASKLNLTGYVHGQLQQLQDWVGHGRYRPSLKVYNEIWIYQDQVKSEEQPFQKVANFVKHASRNKTTGNFTFDGSVIQLRGYLQATELLIKCNLAIFTDFLTLWKRATLIHREIRVDFSANLDQCRELVHLAAETSRPHLGAAGHIYYAHFCSLTLALGKVPLPNPPLATGVVGASQEAQDSSKADPRELLKAEGEEHLTKARELMKAGDWPSKKIMETEIEAVENLLHGGVFYKPVTSDELRAVYRAMASEFRGTGHWYVCERGHPFTVGECGMPMEQARCPECGAPVGGRNHAPAEGVRQASEIEELARDVETMRI
ncbi:hypothetical protein N0V82_007243 [Gnomoniopsis sp. IMI 355080]|nr:hypothetical protein N0V82_007243 [Gnomoniopsis sp. IMI 355080]